jgi:hypothetical protein
MVYPSLDQSVPYVQQVMIFILKSTQNRGLQQGYREIWLEISSMLILRLPHHQWILPLVREEEDHRMQWRSSRCRFVGCLALSAEQRPRNGMEWNDLSSSDRPLPP